MKFHAYATDTDHRFFAAEPIRPEDERLHPVPASAEYNWTETNMFGFNIPEHAIDCMVWFVYRPKLGATFGGVTLWQGFKKHYLECELFDFRVGLPLPQDNTNWTCPNGIEVRMIEPLKSFEIRYKSEDGGISFDLRLDASMVPALRYNGNHITQAMRTSGDLRLNGQRYEINGYYSRDRSWAEHRNEAPLSVPPLSWLAGVFGDDLAFHLTSFESVEKRPEWQGLYTAPRAGEHVLWGYVWDKGRLLGISQADVLIDRPDQLNPMGAALTLRTEDGGCYEIAGRTIALNPAMGWPNIVTRYALMEWRCGDRIGWGDNQDVMFAPHLKHVFSGAG